MSRNYFSCRKLNFLPFTGHMSASHLSNKDWVNLMYLPKKIQKILDIFNDLCLKEYFSVAN